MFEHWADKADPSVRLVTKKGSSLPADLGPRDWKQVSEIEISTETAEAVRRIGFAFVRDSGPSPLDANSRNDFERRWCVTLLSSDIRNWTLCGVRNWTHFVRLMRLPWLTQGPFAEGRCVAFREDGSCRRGW